MDFVELGTLTFQKAWALQEEAVERILQGRGHETVFLLQHSHVITLGRGGKQENLLRPSGLDGHPVPVKRINRGGDVTYHGPGQLIAYPHLDLRQRGRDVHRYLRDLEEVVIRCCHYFEVQGFRRQGLTGVWTKEGKLASIGVGVRRWITMHGLALNVSTDLRYFDLIHPCGIPECPMTSLSQLTGRHIEVAEVLEPFRLAFDQVFGKKAGSLSQS